MLSPIATWELKTVLESYKIKEGSKPFGELKKMIRTLHTAGMAGAGRSPAEQLATAQQLVAAADAAPVTLVLKCYRAMRSG